MRWENKSRVPYSTVPNKRGGGPNSKGWEKSWNFDKRRGRIWKSIIKDELYVPTLKLISLIFYENIPLAPRMFLAGTQLKYLWSIAWIWISYGCWNWNLLILINEGGPNTVRGWKKFLNINEREKVKKNRLSCQPHSLLLFCKTKIFRLWASQETKQGRTHLLAK